MRTVLWLTVLAACGGSTSSQPRSARALVAEASVHDRDAAEHDRAAAAEERAARSDPQCGVRAPRLDADGAPPRLVVPCWTSHQAERDAHVRRAEALRGEAREHRAVAAALLEAERVSCGKIPASERDHSPSWHRDDILAVEPVRDAGPVLGVRLVFRKVAGLSADWLRDAYACHQAEAAVEGYDPAFMPYCPASLAGVTIDAVDRSDGIEVTFRSARPEVGAAILTRADGLRPAP